MKNQLDNKFLLVLAVFSVLGISSMISPQDAISSCASPANQIEAENCLPGTPDNVWDLATPDAGDLSIQGFATDISVNVGDTVHFKINTNATNYTIDIYRMGYYGGNGARLVTRISPSVPLPQTQPACITQTATGLTDCGNWAESASWTVPANSTSGIYFAKLTRTDTGGASHIVFIVRNDASHSAILFQASDATWQAYNTFSQNFYGCNGAFNINCRAYKVSYNRPFYTRTFEPQTWVFDAEYPMVRWLEANGYDVTYFTDTDSDRNGALIRNHKIWMSNGHDEYWSGNQRANVEAARAAGVNLAFFSGNAGYWKTRWENSIDGNNIPFRTLVCYKETYANAVIDPADPPTWTGTWRDPRFSPPADGGRPENALNGTLSRIVGAYEGTMTVPQADGRMRFWRNTSIATMSPGSTATLAPGSLGEELDDDEDNGFRPAGLFHLSTTTANTTDSFLLDYGTLTGPGTIVHHLTLYRAPSGSLVFSAGTYRWAWGLDSEHDLYNLGSTTNINMQQATINLFADMGVQPATLQPGLFAAVASTDSVTPSSAITAPSAGSSFSISVGSTITVTGTASDGGGGVVAGVEVSTDSGATWHPATGRESWSYTWEPRVAGNFFIQSRAVDDSGNLETPSSGIPITILECTINCTLWPSTAAPTVADAGPDGSVELGVKFQAESDGYVSGIRFYKAGANTGTHVGHLWTSAGALLATATFTNETAAGWQQVNFSVPVAVTADTVYIASYHANGGHYSADKNYFTTTGVNSPPLQALANGVSGGNGVYAYGSTSSFPNQSYASSNYWVDVLYNSGSPPALTSINVTPVNATMPTGTTQQFTATGTYSDGGTQNLTGQVTWSSSNTNVATINNTGLATMGIPGNTVISASLNGVIGNASLIVQMTPLTISTSSLPSGTLNSPYNASMAASGGVPPYSWSVASGSLPAGLSFNNGTGAISGAPTATGTFNFTVEVSDSNFQTATKILSIFIGQAAEFTIWPNTATPGLVDGGPDNSEELGVKFRTDYNGYIKGIRFYKATANTGTHVGNLWTSTGTLLATAAFTNETASGWQQVNFSTPVAVTANTVYIASYHTNVGHDSDDLNYFANQGVDTTPLHALANGISGVNGVYSYGSASSFPTLGWHSSNFWVDVVFNLAPPAVLTSIAVSPSNATISTGIFQQYTATGAYSDGSTQNLTNQVTWTSSNTNVATINNAGLVIAVNPGSTSISATINGISGSTNLTVPISPLIVTTSTLPSGKLNSSFSAMLQASGGTTPYSWSITSGSLPPGLSLNSGVGLISGTPTTTGTFSFTVLATDSSNPPQTSTKNFIVIVSATTGFTLWPGTTVPTLVDAGPDNSVELGVKFKSDLNGYITGIRFYKAGTNTGTHVGNLWTSTGTLLATATFANETASGWQQVNFSTPVAITANTVYVVSYHANAGHYSADKNYFATTGVDSPPLHALANGVSGGDGVYAYGSTSSFPSKTYASTNYWVDAVFNSVLMSISVTPIDQIITMGATQQYAATGTYSDGSTQDLTSQVTWASSNNTATINGAGLATATNSGSAIISASFNSISGSTTLNVQPVPLLITTTSLPSGTVNVSYSFVVVANGGTPPYAWSITSGALPSGLTLDTTTGIISGMPSSSGTFNFSVQVIDSGSPVQTATQALTIAVVNSNYTLWPGTTVPTLVDAGPDNSVELGVKFKSDLNGYITGIRFYKAGTNTGTHVGNLWTSTGTLLATATFTNETASGWQQVNFSTPVAITANTVYVVSYHANAGHYSADKNYFATKGMDSPPLHALANGVSGGDGVYAYGSTSSFPSKTYLSTNYWVDVVFSP